MTLPSLRVLSIGALGLLFGFGAASPAFAHADILSTLPADGSSVDDVPEVAIVTGEDLLTIGENAKGFVVAVSDADGYYYGDGCITIDGAIASMPVQLGEPGVYTVTYRVVSADGHPVEGSYSFTYTGESKTFAVDANIPKCGDTVEPTPVPVSDETDAPVVIATPMPISENPEPASPNDMGVVPWVGLATIPVIGAGIWVLVRLLGKRKSEDND